MTTTKTFLLACVAAALVAAQEPARVGIGVIERKLSLAETLELALRNNLDLEIERTSVASSRQLLNAAKGAFDGTFRWQPTLESRNTPTTNVLFGANGKLTERFHNQNFSFVQKLPWQGATVQAGFDNSRQSTNNPFAGLNPYTQSRFLIGLSQPLWRNRLIDQDRAQLRIRAKAIDISESDLELRVIDVVNRAELAYWDLVGARQAVRVAAEGVQWGDEQVARSKRMIDAGSLAPVELAGAEAELERRRDTYLASLNTVTDTENTLKTIIASGKEDPIWNDAVIPTEEQAVASPAAVELQPLIDAAIERRPEVRQVALRRASNDIEKEFAADQLKPQVNLIANYTNSGLAGTIPAGSGANPFAASSAVQTDRINELSARAGSAAAAGSKFRFAPRQPHRRLRIGAVEPVRWQLPWHSGGSDDGLVHTQSNREGKRRQRRDHREAPGARARPRRTGDRRAGSLSDAVARDGAPAHPGRRGQRARRQGEARKRDTPVSGGRVDQLPRVDAPERIFGFASPCRREPTRFQSRGGAAQPGDRRDDGEP